MDAESAWALDLSIAFSVPDLHVLAHGDRMSHVIIAEPHALFHTQNDFT